MENKTEYLEDLRIIKKVMEESSRFLSLSGLSGIFAGLIALAGAAVSVFVFLDGSLILNDEMFSLKSAQELSRLKTDLALLAVFVLVLSIAVSLWFSRRNAVRKNQRIWTPVSRKFLINMIVPLVTGGILIMIFLLNNEWHYIMPAMLVFYGLSLVSATKFTYNDIFYLGLIEVLCGLAAAALPAYGIILWSLGFGLLHIVYGLLLYRKYEK